MIKVRKGQAPPPHSREEFGVRFRAAYFDPAFRAEQAALDRLEAIAWGGHHEERKAPVTRRAGPGENLTKADTETDDRLRGPYATSHDTLDRANAVQDEVRNAARALAEAVGELRAGRLSAPGAELATPRPK